MQMFGDVQLGSFSLIMIANTGPLEAEDCVACNGDLGIATTSLALALTLRKPIERGGATRG